MKKSLYLLLILALPGFAIAQTTQKKTTTTKTTTVKKTTVAKKPVAGTTRPQPATAPAPSHIAFQTFVNGTDFMVNSNFQIGKDYVLIVTDDKKNTVFTANFNAQSNAQNVTMQKPLAKGTYHVTVHEKNNQLAKGSITLVMN